MTFDIKNIPVHLRDSYYLGRFISVVDSAIIYLEKGKKLGKHLALEALRDEKKKYEEREKTNG